MKTKEEEIIEIKERLDKIEMWLQRFYDLNLRNSKVIK